MNEGYSTESLKIQVFKYVEWHQAHAVILRFSELSDYMVVLTLLITL